MKMLNCKSNNFVFILGLSLAFPSLAQRLEFKDDGASQYAERHDSKAGITVIDRLNNLEFTKCFAGMESSKENNSCNGNPIALSWDNAIKFANQIGGKWRLPTTDEMVVYASSNIEFGKLNRAWGRDTYGVDIWTSQRIHDGHDNVRASFKWSISSHPSGRETVKISSSERSEKKFIIFVRTSK